MALHRALDELPLVTVIQINALERSHETPLISLKNFLSLSEPLCYCRKIDENPPHLLSISLTQII